METDSEVLAQVRDCLVELRRCVHAGLFVGLGVGGVGVGIGAFVAFYRFTGLSRLFIVPRGQS